MEVQVLSTAPTMLFNHSNGKLFPKFRHLLFIEFLSDKEPSNFEIEFEEVDQINNRQKDWFTTKTGNHINFALAKSYFFDTQIYCKIQEDQWNWRSLTDNLLKKIYSDEGQLLLMKREMNVTN